jgi:hypothetical protein
MSAAPTPPAYNADNLRELQAMVSFCTLCLQGLVAMIDATKPDTMLPADKLGALLGPVAEQMEQADALVDMLNGSQFAEVPT